jgi:exodeoxyribonuclease-3
MNIISWNVNGLRSAARQGLFEWVRSQQPDALCLQEIKISADQLTPGLIDIPGYTAHFNFADKRGYSGVAIYSKLPAIAVTTEVIPHAQFNSEGRSLLIKYSDFSVLNLYLPHGGRDKSKLLYKLAVYEQLLEFLQHYYDGKPLILVGDFNIAHTELDLARPRQNQHNIMFTPEERQLLDRLLVLGWIDSFREANPKLRSYTWWPWLATARERDIGWRLDYCFVPKALHQSIMGADILPDVSGSDHCPVELTLK